MSIIEQATKRLEDLASAGVVVPWAAAGLAHSAVQSRVESGRHHAAVGSTPAAVVRRIDETVESMRAAAPALHQPLEDTESQVAVTLDLERLERSGHLVPTQTRSALSEEFRHIKQPLLRNARGKDAAANRCSLIMVTSALPGEGKTFCSINLAMSMAAEIDTSILLVDADVLHPEVLQRLGVQADKGLLDVLTQPDLKLSDVVLKTNVPKLSILPAGRHNNLSTELLASEGMEALLVSLTVSYPGRIVIFDAPPLLVTNEAKVLASRIGQVVLVVGASSTSRRDVAHAFAALEQCPLVMSVLNRAHEPKVAHGYGYYHG
ncbi:MAG: XrtA-associated tyrosine autokinase [Burkholderiaceae bacterium]